MTDQEQLEDDAPRVYDFIDGDSYVALESKNKWVVEPILSSGGIINIYGRPKAGKTQLSFGLGLAVANGEKEWMGFPVHVSGPVVYFQADNPRASFQEKIRGLKKAGYNVKNIHIADPESIPYPFDLLDEETDHAGVLHEMLGRLKARTGVDPAMVFIDTIREVHSGDEDKSTILRNVIVKLVAATRPAALVLVSHSRKGGGLSEGPSSKDEDGPRDSELMDENRGSGYLAGRMETIVRVTQPPGKKHGYMTYQGRSVGRERVRMKMNEDDGTYLWNVERDPVQELARELLTGMEGSSERAIAQELAEACEIDFEAARSVVRREKAKMKKNKS